MNEIIERIAKIEEEINRLTEEKRELVKQNSNYYIGVESIGDGNYWDEYIHRLGFITEEVALEWQNEDVPSYVIGREYYAVNEEQYKLYGEWYSLYEAFKALYPNCVANLDSVCAARDSIENRILNIVDELAIEYPEFQHISEDLMLKNR